MTRSTSYFSHFKQSFREWLKNDAFGKSAALAYYAVFSLPGLLIIVITVAGILWNTQEIQNELTQRISDMVGPEAARHVETMITSSSKQSSSTLALLIGIVAMTFGATGVFFQLQKSLNDTWEVERKPGAGIKEMLASRLTALVLVLTIGFIVLLSMMATAAVSLMDAWIREHLVDVPAFVLMLVQEAIFFALFSFLIALIFKVLPDVEIPLKAVWPGALITALLFAMGKFLLSVYFSEADPTSAFGTAGSFVLLLLWAYYSSLIFLLGATFTHVYAQSKGYRFVPTKIARHNEKYRLRQLEGTG